MADDATGRDSDKFMLRLPDGMRARLKAEAEANKRSMNAEIVARLQASLEATEDDLGQAAPILAALHEQVQRGSELNKQTEENLREQLLQLESIVAALSAATESRLSEFLQDGIDQVKATVDKSG